MTYQMSLIFNSACFLHIVVTTDIIVKYKYVHEQFAVSLHLFVFHYIYIYCITTGLILYNDLTEDCRKGMKLIVSKA